jgi:hypothetical protein
MRQRIIQNTKSGSQIDLRPRIDDIAQIIEETSPGLYAPRSFYPERTGKAGKIQIVLKDHPGD